MILFPAIDLKDGACVRLLRGDMAQATVFNRDPAAQARAFAAAGFAWLHVVDLDGAVEGRAVNADAVADILRSVRMKVQLGGGIRDLDAVARWLEAGVDRVVLGTVAVENPDLVVAASARWPGRIAVGIDARDGRAAVAGWTRTSDLAALDLALRLDALALGAFVYTDIERDGALQGPNVAATAAFARALRTPVIASGGVASLDDLRRLKAEEDSGIAGAICGRALYDGRIEAVSARALMEGPAPPGAC